MLDCHNLRVGCYYKSENTNGSYLYFRVVKKDVPTNIITISVVTDNDIYRLKIDDGKEYELNMNTSFLSTFPIYPIHYAKLMAEVL